MYKKLFVLLIVSALVIFSSFGLAACGAGDSAASHPGGSSEGSGEAAKPAITAILGTDLHYLSPSLTDGGEYFQRMMENSDAKAMQYSEEIIEGFVAQVLEMKPNFLLLSGDVSFNGEKISHEELAVKLKAIEEAGTSVLIIPGNHDVYSETAASFSGDTYELVEAVTSTGFAKIYDDFGFSEARSRDEKSLSYMYELAPDLWALMVDVNTRHDPGVLTEDTYNWIRGQLEEAKAAGADVISVSHQNLLLHNSLFTYGYIMEGSGRLASLFEEFGVKLNLSGHMHIQHISETEGGLVDIATSALSVSPYQFGVLDFFSPSSDSESNEKSAGSGGYRINYHTEMTDFEHYEDAVKFMRDRSLGSAKRSYPNLSEAHQNFYADINTSYFAGRMDLVEWDDEMFKDLMDGPFMSGMYLQTVYDDGLKNHTEKSL